jgi:sugar/nucleoside kinase (ribokinase family)
MSLTVVGSIAFDAVETETGKRPRLLGGAAVHFALASSFLAETRVIGPVGDDFGEEEYAVLRNRGVITDDIEHVEGGKTFFWAGRYERDVNIRHTLQTDLNVFEHFEPKLSDEAKAAETLFLANIQPDLQRAVREQCEAARFSALDSMNLWIDIAHDSLVRTIGMVDAVILNDGEVRQLTDEPNLVKAAALLLDMGPRVVVAKQGEYGSAMFTREGVFGLPAYPTPDVVDPTGAGDSFAGGFMGYVAAAADEVTDELLRTAMAYGTALASFNVEGFGTERMGSLTGEEITLRVEALQAMSRFEAAPLALRG